MKPQRGFGVVALIAASLALSGCVTPVAEAPPPTDTSAPTITPQPGTGTNTEPPTAPAVTDPTCETLIPATLVEQFESTGWSFQQSKLFGADAALPDSIQCTWGDYDSASSDAVQVFAWSPIDDETAIAMQDHLVAQGWQRETEGDIVYITAGDRSPTLDENGYGLTYRFADGVVTFADTKQSLLLVRWPR